MKNYEKPNMKLLVLEAEDVITLSVNNEFDPVIGEGGNNPWATSAE